MKMKDLDLFILYDQVDAACSEYERALGWSLPMSYCDVWIFSSRHVEVDEDKRG